MGVMYCGQDGGGEALRWDTRQGLGWGSRHMVGSSHVVGYQTQVRYKTGMVGYQIGMVWYQTGMVGYQIGMVGVPDVGGSTQDAGDGIPNVGRVPDRGRVTTLTSHQSDS